VARGRVLYRVSPTTFFDVTMRVNYVGRKSFFADNFGTGGTEAILIKGPSFFVPVKVTVRGFRGQAGCFDFLAG
jgi:hypothetical protein